MPDEDSKRAAYRALAGNILIFALVVCAAVGQSSRLSDGGLAALTEAAGGEEAG